MKKINYSALKGIPTRTGLLQFKKLIEKEEEEVRALHSKSLDKDFDVKQAVKDMLALRKAYRQLEILATMPNTIKDIEQRLVSASATNTPVAKRLF